MSHLTDEQLQDYLDGNLSKSDAAVIHIDSCPECRNALADYKAVFAGLETESEFSLSDSFATNVMDNLPDITFNPLEAPPKIRDSYIMFAMLALMIGAGLYFIDVIALVKPLIGWAETQDAVVVEKFSSLKEQASGSGKLPLIVLMTILTMGCIAGIDKLIKSRRESAGVRSFMA